MSQYSPRPYARITFRNSEGKRRTLLVEVLRETDRHLTGYVVDREGSRTAETAPMHLIVLTQRDIISRIPMRLNFHYGELERCE